MEVVIDYEYLTWARGEEVPKEVAVASENSIETFRFLPSYTMNPHSSRASGLKWDDGIIPYSSLFQTLTEATANFAYLYSKGDAKCEFLSAILRRSVQNLDSFGCPDRSVFRMTKECSMPCHKFPDKSCALRNASNFYGWLKHHFQEKEYVKCPQDDTRHLFQPYKTLMSYLATHQST
jgi:hypothetical protein